MIQSSKKLNDFQALIKMHPQVPISLISSIQIYSQRFFQSSK